jgi:FlaA1/EpsC-like NDP-sugar epimerase
MYELWFEMKKSLGSSELIPLIGNVTNKKTMFGFFEKYRPNIVYHAAAYKHVPLMELQPAVAIFNNIGGTKNLADLSVEFGVEKFIMVSTDKAVNPTNVMGATKRASEIYIQTLNNRLLAEGVQNPTQFVTTRFGNVLGSNGSVVPLFKRQIENGGPVTVTHRDITRYFMTIPEACSLVLEASCTGTGGQIYIFDMGEPVKIYDLAEKMIRLAGKKPGRDIEIHETGLRPGEKLYEELLANSENTIPTANKKIMIAKVRTYDYKEVDPKISKLIEASQTNGSTFVIVKLLKNLIPEYISHNSVFEQLD